MAKAGRRARGPRPIRRAGARYHGIRRPPSPGRCEACARWGFRQACLSRTLLGAPSWERGRPARTGAKPPEMRMRAGRPRSQDARVPGRPCPCRAPFPRPPPPWFDRTGFTRAPRFRSMMRPCGIGGPCPPSRPASPGGERALWERSSWERGRPARIFFRALRPRAGGTLASVRTRRSQDAVPAQAAPWGEVHQHPPRTDPEPWKHAVPNNKKIRGHRRVAVSRSA